MRDLIYQAICTFAFKLVYKQQIDLINIYDIPIDVKS